MLASLLGALVGGFFALAGGWFGLRWQAEREARRVAGAILAELSVAENMLQKDGAAAYYKQLLSHWKETGEVANREAIISIFDNDPQDTLPVYYSMAPSLGLLPRSLASDVVEYHARIIALPRVVVRFLGRQDFDQESVKLLAHSIEAQLDRVTEMRRRLISELTAFASRPISVLRLGA